MIIYNTLINKKYLIDARKINILNFFSGPKLKKKSRLV